MAEALSLLGMDDTNLRCSYCGQPATDFDHFRPVVKGRRPTGFATDVRNMVPACGPCNQSKGGQYWRDWIMGKSIGAQRTHDPWREDRILRLEQFEKWSAHSPLNIDAIVGRGRMLAYWQRLEQIKEEMQDAQAEADSIRALVQKFSERPRG